ncbi:Uncharacterized protein Rs2_23782 [Raphanus sativus]|nr:Uncharacterized protein Rs2_23782 [Raphanus sativus]
MEADFICKAWIVEVLQHNGWSSFAYRMQQKLDKSSTSIRWNRCVSPNATGVIRGAVSSYQLMMATIELLRCLEELAGKENIFKICVTSYIFTSSHRIFTVSKSSSNNQAPIDEGEGGEAIASVSNTAAAGDYELNPPSLEAK